MFTSINPATGEKIGVYEELTSAETEAKLNKAASTFQQWRTTTLSERAELLGNIADQFDANKDRLARMATQEMGKTYASAIAEVKKCVAGFRHYARNGPAMLEPQQQPLGNGVAELCWQPLRSEEHTTELQTLMRNSSAGRCFKTTKTQT